MKRENYDGRGNSYDTNDPTTGPYISLFTAYGSPDRRAWENIKDTPYSIINGAKVTTMTPAEAFAYLNDDRNHKGNYFYRADEAAVAWQVVEASKEIYRNAIRNTPAEAAQEGSTEIMKHSETANYFEDLRNAYKASRVVYEELIERQSEENSRFQSIEQERKAGKISDHDYTIAKANHITAEDDIKHSLATTRETLEKKIAATRADLAAFLNDKYRAKAGEVDAAALELLNTGVCTADELADMANAYRNNATMRRIIAGHASALEQKSGPESNEGRTARNLVYALTRAAGGQTELAAFDNLATWAARGVDDNGEYTTRVFNSRFDGVYNEITDTIKEF